MDVILPVVLTENEFESSHQEFDPLNKFISMIFFLWRGLNWKQEPKPGLNWSVRKPKSFEKKTKYQFSKKNLSLNFSDW